MKNYRKFFLMTCFILAVGIILFPATTKAAQPGWERLLQITLKHPTNKAAFLNESYGITVGFGGECHYTFDAGKAWPKADNNSLCRFGLDMVDQNLAWHCGNGGTVGFTNDGGKSWHIAGSCGLVGTQISFVNSTSGWVCDGSSRIVVTNNAGADWTNLRLPEGLSAIGGINLMAENTGYLLNADGSTLYSTNDNGSTWQAKKTGIKEQLFAPFIRFINSQQGFIVAFAVNRRTEVILVTVNGGATWKMEPLNQELCAPYLSHDGNILTLTYTDKSIVVLRRTEVK